MKKILTSNGEYVLDDRLIFGVYTNSKNEILVDKISYRMLDPVTNERVYSDEKLANPPYNYTKVEIDDKYSDCQASDFDEDLTFNLEKYSARKQKEIAEPRIRELKQLLASQDYKTIKYMQGELTEEEFAEVKAQCKSWRDEINKLEQEQVKNEL